MNLKALHPSQGRRVLSSTLTLALCGAEALRDRSSVTPVKLDYYNEMTKSRPPL